MPMSDTVQTIPVRVQPPYLVTIGPGLLAESGERLRALLGPCRIAVLTDSTVAPLYRDTVTAALSADFPAILLDLIPRS